MNALTTNLLAAMSRSRFILFIIRGRNLRQIQIGLCVCYILISGNVLLFHFHPPGPVHVPASGSASREANSLSFFSSPSITSSGDSTRSAATNTTTAAAADTVTPRRGNHTNVGSSNDDMKVPTMIIVGTQKGVSSPASSSYLHKIHFNFLLKNLNFRALKLSRHT
jgi:hypothetical protein